MWIVDHFPTLLIQQKWHTEHWNVNVGDMLIHDSNEVRGKWKLGKVSKCKISDDNKVCCVAKFKNQMNQYMNTKEDHTLLLKEQFRA